MYPQLPSRYLKLLYLAALIAMMLTLTACGTPKDLVIKDGTTTIRAHQYENNTTLESVVIPNSVTTIEEYAFKGCTNLQSVVIPDSVTVIGDGAFNGCLKLQSIVIPDSVTYVGHWAFFGCESLNDVTLPAAAEYNESFLENPKLTTLTITGDHFRESKGFIDTLTDRKTRYETPDKTLESVTVTGSVTIIPEYTFAYCRNLKSIKLPDTVTTIEAAAFGDCVSLETIELPDSLTTIGDTAFGWSGITSIKIPASVTSIGDKAFRNCTSLTHLTIPPSVASIGEDIFYECVALRKVVREIFPTDFESAVDVTKEKGRLIPEGARVVPMGEYQSEENLINHKPWGIFDSTLYNLMPEDVRSADWFTADYAIILDWEVHRNDNVMIITTNAYGTSVNSGSSVSYNIYLCGRDGTIRKIGTSSDNTGKWVWSRIADLF